MSLEARVRGDGWGREFRARLADLGLGGACIEAPSAPAPGNKVTVEIDAPTLWDPLVLHAEVAWCTEPSGPGPVRVGLCFDHHAAPQLRALIDLLALDASSY